MKGMKEKKAKKMKRFKKKSSVWKNKDEENSTGKCWKDMI